MFDSLVVYQLVISPVDLVVQPFFSTTPEGVQL